MFSELILPALELAVRLPGNVVDVFNSDKILLHASRGNAEDAPATAISSHGF
jgi:hypothetical protein